MKATVYTDSDSTMNPREWDNLGTMYCWHRRYILGDEQPSESPEEWYKNNVPEGSVVLPLYLYDHSGITMSTGGFSCPWDSGQVGWIVCTPDKIRKEYSKKRISKQLRARVEQYLKNEVTTYDNYLTGNVFGYTIENDEGEHVDSCGGFYGDDLEGMIGQAGEKYRQILSNAWENRFEAAHY